MKKIIITTVFIVVAVFLYTARNSFLANKAVPGTGEHESFRPDPSSATFIFDDELVTLSAGRNESIVAPGSALLEETILMDQFAYGDINADGKEDTALLLARYGAGSGTFIYAAAFVSGPVTYRGSKAIFIGDRIAPQSISINEGVVTVIYLDRGPGEALAAEPTIMVSKQFVYRAGEFKER